jgi:hypothetical protein
MSSRVRLCVQIAIRFHALFKCKPYRDLIIHSTPITMVCLSYFIKTKSKTILQITLCRKSYIESYGDSYAKSHTEKTLSHTKLTLLGFLVCLIRNSHVVYCMEHSIHFHSHMDHMEHGTAKQNGKNKSAPCVHPDTSHRMWWAPALHARCRTRMGESK